MIPAYQELADSLESLRGTGKSSRGLAFLRWAWIYSTCCKARQELMYLSDKLKDCQLSFCPTIGISSWNRIPPDRQAESCSGEHADTDSDAWEASELMKRFPNWKMPLTNSHHSSFHEKFLNPAFTSRRLWIPEPPAPIYQRFRTYLLLNFQHTGIQGFRPSYQTVSFAEIIPLTSDIWSPPPVTWRLGNRWILRLWICRLLMKDLDSAKMLSGLPG